jgi:hypothetical protein
MADPTGDPLRAEDAEGDTAAELVGGFPRHTTRDLVESREDQLRFRLPLAGLALAAGVTLCALGLPTERLAGPGPALIDSLASGGWSSSRALYLPLAQLADALPRVGAEPAGFLLSALALGALAALVWRLGRQLEAAPEARWLTALVVLGTPLLWTAGTSPGPEILGALGALYVFSALLGSGRARALRAGLGWGFAAGMAPLYLWCLPAAAWGFARGRSAGRAVSLGMSWAIGWALAWLALTAAAKHFAGSDPRGWLDLARALGRDALAGGGGPQDASWLLGAFPALGVSLLGLCGLFLRGPDGERAPAWVLAWCLTPALGLGLSGRVDWELSWLWMPGPLALGWYRLLAARPRWTGRAATLALAAAALLSVGLNRAWLRASDPETPWRALVEGEVRRGDILLTTSATHQHLAARRYGLRSFEIHQTARLSRSYRAEALAALVRRIAPAHAAGSRVLIDRPLEADERELLELVSELERHVRIDVLPAAVGR